MTGLPSGVGTLRIEDGTAWLATAALLRGMWPATARRLRGTYPAAGHARWRESVGGCA